VDKQKPYSIVFTASQFMVKKTVKGWLLNTAEMRFTPKNLFSFPKVHKKYKLKQV